MSSMVGCQAWHARFTESAPPRPAVSRILNDLKEKQLEVPIFVCLHCTKETHSQHAMAAHCRQHIRAGMGKGTVEHIKYYPDHTFIFLCNAPQPSPTPQAPRTTTQPAMAEPLKPVNQALTGRSNRTLPYTGCFSMTDLARSPWLLNWSRQNVIHTSNLHASTHATLQPPTPWYNLQVGGSSSLFPYANGVGSSATPASVPPEIDLTLRLGPPVARPKAEVSTPGTGLLW